MPVSGVYLSRFGHLAQCHVIGLPKRDAKPQIFWISGSGSRTHGHLCGRVERSPFPPRMVVSKYLRWMAVDRFGRETQWSSTSSAAFAKWTVSLYSVDVTIKLRKPLEWQILG